MKSSFIGNILSILFLFSISFLFPSCSDDEIQADPTAGLLKISEGYALGAAAKVEIWSLQELSAGYNPVFIALYDSLSGERITDSHIHLHPIMDMHTMLHSCPIENPESTTTNLFPGSIMFTMPSGSMGTWTLEVSVHNHLNGLKGKAIFDITVNAPSPSKIISFKTDDGTRYYIGYQFPEKIKVGVNEFEVIAYTFTDGQFVPAENMTVRLTPEMPSMDHGSPNNEDPIHVGKGHYKGKVNFTMTGEWRLNLDLSEGSSALGLKYFYLIVE